MCIDEHEPLRDCDCHACAIAERNRLRLLLKNWADETLLREGPRIDAPGHSHEAAGVWDSDNGKFAGKPCAKCALWREAKHMRCDVHNA